MKTAIIHKYVPYISSYEMYALWCDKYLIDAVHASDKEGLGRLIEYALNCGFNQIKIVDSTKQ